MSLVNLQLDAPGYSTWLLTCTGVGYGQQLDANTLQSRRFQAFYSHLATSEQWFVELHFKNWSDHNNFNNWLVGFYNRVTDPGQTPLMPMWATLLSKGSTFNKRGYPVTAAEFGDEFGKITYAMTLYFIAADDASLDSAIASKYVPPISDAVARAFAPIDLGLDPTRSQLLNPYNPWEGESAGPVFPT